MADVNFAGVSTPLGRFLAVTGFGSVQGMVGVRQTPVLGYSGLIGAALAAAPPATGILATFNDNVAVAGVGANTQEILNAPSNWRGFVTGIEVAFPGDLAMANLDDYLAACYIRVTMGGIDTDVPLAACIRLSANGTTAAAGGGFYNRQPYFFSAPLFWPGDGSEVVRVMANNAIAGAVALQLSLTLHVALGRSQDNAAVQPGFGGPTQCVNGEEYMSATASAAAVRRSFSG
jgi:hypothetical protein